MKISPSENNPLYGTSLTIADGTEKLFTQNINLVVCEQLMKQHFVADNRSSDTADEETQLTKDELNALSYACGYVISMVLKKYEK